MAVADAGQHQKWVYIYIYIQVFFISIISIINAYIYIYDAYICMDSMRNHHGTLFPFQLAADCQRVCRMAF